MERSCCIETVPTWRVIRDTTVEGHDSLPKHTEPNKNKQKQTNEQIKNKVVTKIRICVKSEPMMQYIDELVMNAEQARAKLHAIIDIWCIA